MLRSHCAIGPFFRSSFRIQWKTPTIAHDHRNDRLSRSLGGTMGPRQRPPTQPGEILPKEILEPMGISQMVLAKARRVPVQRANTLINGKRGVSAETAR